VSVRLAIGIALLCACASSAHAHKPSDSYLRLGEPILRQGSAQLPLRWDIALRDLDRVLGVDANRDGSITWGEVRAADRGVRALLTAHLVGALDGASCTLDDRTTGPPQITHHSDGAYAVYLFDFVCPRTGNTFALDYSLLFDLDPQHRGLMRAPNGGEEQVLIFTRQQRHTEISLPAARSPSRRLVSAIKEGVHHIWTGYDHMLFLLALLLPAVLRREGGRWVPVEKLRPALTDVVKVVTAFTAAHSVTLSLAALGVLSLPSRLVESAIAASVVLAALNNVWPLVKADRWLAAFALGLLHGFGFSSTLADLGLSTTTLLPTLIGFNLGVELGQGVVVATFVPIAFALRRKAAYRWGALQLGSIVIAVIAALWLCERMFGIVLISR